MKFVIAPFVSPRSLYFNPKTNNLCRMLLKRVRVRVNLYEIFVYRHFKAIVEALSQGYEAYMGQPNQHVIWFASSTKNIVQEILWKKMFLLMNRYD